MIVCLLVKNKMRLFKLINEESEFEKVKKDIVAECSDILKVYSDTGRVFFRGLRKSNNYGYVTPRNDRKPMDTPKEIHEIFDEVFKKKFGWRARSEGVFVTSSKITSNYYGEPAVFYPVNGWKFIWSPNINDLYVDYIEDDNFLKKYEDEFEKKYGPDGLGYWTDHLSKKYKFNKVDDIINHLKEKGFEIVNIYNNIYNNIYRRFELKNSNDKLEYRIYTWHPEIDWNEYRNYIIYDAIKKIVDLYKSINIEQSIKFDNEVMFKCFGYYYISEKLLKGNLIWHD